MTEYMSEIIALFVVHINTYIYIIWDVLYKYFILYLVGKLNIHTCDGNGVMSIIPV